MPQHGGLGRAGSAAAEIERRKLFAVAVRQRLRGRPLQQRLVVEAQQRGLCMLVGSDNQAKVYLNGKQIHEYHFRRRFLADEDKVPEITLNAGINVVVFKVVKATGHWAEETDDWKGSIRLTDGQGNPVQGIKVTLTP